MSITLPQSPRPRLAGLRLLLTRVTRWQQLVWTASPRRPTLVVRIGRGNLEAEVVRRGRVLWSGTAPYETPDDLVEALAQLAAEDTLPGRPRAARAVLEPPLVQVRTLRGLPPVRRPALRALVGLQAGRFFRRNGKPLVTDAAWDRPARHAGAVVRAAAVEEPWVDAVVTGVRAAGLELASVRPALAPDWPALELLSAAERARRHGVARLALRRLVIMAAALWGIAGVVAVTRLERERQRVTRELAALDGPVRAVVAARRRLGEVARAVETVDVAERDRAAVLALVGRLVAALPDSTYLTSVDVAASGAGSVTGVARQAAHVAAALERGGVMRKAELAGPAVREVLAGREWERFTIRFTQRGAP